jgi:hypothetical protein
MLEREPDADLTMRIRVAIADLTAAAARSGTIRPDITADDVFALVSAMRGLVQAEAGLVPDIWQRFLDIHVAGMRPA